MEKNKHKVHAKKKELTEVNVCEVLEDRKKWTLLCLPQTSYSYCVKGDPQMGKS